MIQGDWFIVQPVGILQITAPSVPRLDVGKCAIFCTKRSSDDWAKDVWANYVLGDIRLGDKLGRYGDSKSDGWAKCVKEEKLQTSDTIIR